MDFLPSSGHPFTVSDKVPARYRAYRMAAARALYAEDASGQYFIQSIAGKGFRTQLNIFRIPVAGASLYPATDKSCAALHFMLQGDIRCRLQGFGEARLHEGLYHLFYVPGGIRHELRFGVPGLYLSFHIELSPPCLKRLSDKHSEVKEVLDKMLAHSDRGIRQHPAHISRESIHLIEALKHCPYREEPEKSLYLENRIQELLLLYVQDTPATGPALSIMERRMQKVKYYLDYHKEEHLTLPAVAADVHLSITTFKRWFMQYFGKSFQQYLLEKRMEYAKVLLRDTDKTLLEIAGKTGYSDAATFSRAFKKYTGISPGGFRKENF